MTALLLMLGLALAAPPQEEAVAAYLEGDYSASVDHGLAALEAGAVNGDVYYNLGNALYREGRLAEAVLAWRRAALLMPRDGDTVANLERARRETRDRIEWPAQGSALFWRDSLSLREQGWGAAILLALVGALGLIRRKRPLPIEIPALLLGVPGVLLAASTAVAWQELSTYPGAVVLVEQAQVRSAGGGGVVIFELHEGAEVRLWERVADQVQVALPDGRRGWMRADALGVVDPRAPFPLTPPEPSG
ncbi:MAG: tetratricopeptide repeat protein [Alphaproteobacteria bacterium]|nr:tetratricopeptide repeat protein [Alphaproteobacteria bacterium]